MTAPASRCRGTCATRWPSPARAGAHDHAATERAEDAHGHGHGGHAGMSMDAMVRDMRNRFVVALVFTIPIVLWSMVGTKLLGTELADPVRHRPRRLAVPAEPAGRPLRVVDLLHRRGLRPAQPDAGHDGPRRRGHRRRLAVLRRRDVLHRGRGLLRGRRHARDVRAARALVRDARPRRRQRRHPRAAGPRAAHGRRAPRRRSGRGPDRRGAGRRPAADPPRREGPRRRGRRGGREPGRRVHGHRREPAGHEDGRRRAHRRDHQRERHAARPCDRRSAPTPRWRRSSSSSRRPRTPRRPASGWPTGRRSGWCSSRSSAAA